VPRPANTQFAVACHVLTLLGGLPEARMSSEEMADSVGANPVYLRRVLGHLRRAGLVDSRPGVGGGWELCRAPEAITLGDAWRAIHGDEPLLGLHEVNPRCPVGRQVAVTLSELDRRAAHAVEAELDRTTVRDVLPAPGTVGVGAAAAAPGPGAAAA
jgi:Rrf2 family protein